MDPLGIVLFTSEMLKRSFRHHKGGSVLMKFHNIAISVYPAPMMSLAHRTILARLRNSARLAALVLLIFALKIGTVAACAGHDFADMGLGTGNDHALVMSASDLDGSGDAKTALSSHLGSCGHCGSHHAPALAPEFSTFLVFAPPCLSASLSALPPCTQLSSELRPPIV